MPLPVDVDVDVDAASVGGIVKRASQKSIALTTKLCQTVPDVLHMSKMNDLANTLAAAYEHLYDIVYLRTHPIAILVDEQTHSGPDRGWQMHHALIEAIDELNPGGRAPTLSREWRRHRLMRLRYVEGLPPQDVADALAISRRQYYRVHDEAMRALAATLLARPQAEATASPAKQTDRIEMIWAERERYGDGATASQLAPVIESTLDLLADRLAQHRVQPNLMLAPALPSLNANPKLLRQLLLSVTDYLVERARNATLLVTAQAEGDAARIEIGVELASGASFAVQGNEQEQLAACDELAALNGVHLSRRTAGQAMRDVVRGFVLRAPIETAQLHAMVVLVVDDNTDTLELYRRYLEPQGYDVVTARNSHEALDALARCTPIAVFLDLMLPEQDGWDILQLLKSRPGNNAIPVFICSVLMQKELALSLGAAGFLRKPFTPSSLKAALDGLNATSP